MDSILVTIKKTLGVEQEYTHFDQDILMHIRTVIFILSQIGIGPEDGFQILGEEETWSDLLGERKDIEAVKSFMFLKVRLLFDPPTSSFLLAAMERLCNEFEWRLNVQAEKGTVVITSEGGVCDG